MDRLAQDLIVGILCRLNAKCLLRLRCVSRSFCRLIDGQEFTKAHLKRSLETDSHHSLIILSSRAAIPGASSNYNDGRVHWLAAKTPGTYDDDDVIVALDVESEEFHKMQLPENRNSVYCGYLGSFRGCLYFNGLFDYPEPVHTWVKHESWTKQFSFPRCPFGPLDYVKALAYSKRGTKVLVHRLTYEDNEGDNIYRMKFYWYDLQIKRLSREVRIQGVP